MRVSHTVFHLLSHPGRFPLSRLSMALVLGQMAMAGAAWADKHDASVDSIHPKRIEVLSNGVAHTKPAIPLVSLSANLVVDIDAGYSGRVKSWKAWLKATPKAPGNTMATADFSQHPHSESYPVGSRPKKVQTRGVGVTVPNNSLKPFLVDHCNWMANDLRSKGMSNQVIFSQDRVIPVYIYSETQADFSGVKGHAVPEQIGNIPSQATFQMLEVVCKGQGGINPDIGPVAGDIKIKTEARLTSVNASVLHDSHPHSCPTQATARVTFVSDTEGPFTWRFTSASGKVSPPIRLEMRPSDQQGKLYIRSYDQKFMVGEKVSATGGGSGGSGGAGVGGAALGGGFATPTRPGSDLPGAQPTGQGHKPVGGSYATPTVPRMHQDALRAVVLNAAPGSVERSDAASYQVHCPVEINPGAGSLPGELQGSTTPAAAPTRNVGVLVPGAVKTAPPAASLPPGVRKPVAPVAPVGQRVAPTVAPATPVKPVGRPVARPPVPVAGEAEAPSGRTPRFGGQRGQAAEGGRAGLL